MEFKNKSKLRFSFCNCCPLPLKTTTMIINYDSCINRSQLSLQKNSFYSRKICYNFALNRNLYDIFLKNIFSLLVSQHTIKKVDIGEY